MIPAEHRVTFRAGVNLVEAIFFSAFIRLFVPWVVQTDYIQRTLRDATEGMLKAKNRQKMHLIDEL